VIPVLIKDLENQKYLPYNIYNKNGRLIFRIGEIITPGKLLQLRFIEIYRESDSDKAKSDKENKVKNQNNPAIKDKLSGPSLTIVKPIKPVIMHHDRIGEVNFDSVISQDSQIAIKTSIHDLIDSMTVGEIPDSAVYTSARDKIVTEVLATVSEVEHLNQLRIFDDYDYSHGINVSILSVMLGYKMGLNSYLLRPLALGSLLHDIGKVRIPKNIINKKGALTPKEYEIVKLHAPLGYKIIKDELNLPEEIAKLAFEHQEKFDGTGYPRGISGEAIDTLSQIVSVCDVYDALVSTKVYANPKPSQDALKIMLNYGSKWFNPSILYKFIHMSSFNE